MTFNSIKNDNYTLKKLNILKILKLVKVWLFFKCLSDKFVIWKEYISNLTCILSVNGSFRISI